MALAPPLAYRALDANGDPVSGAKLYFFDATTETPREVYADAGLTSPISQPVVANSAGWFPAIYINGTAGNYKDRLLGADDVPLRPDIDNITPPVAGTVPITQGGTGSTTAAAARSALSTPSQAQHDAVDGRLETAETTIANYIDSQTETVDWATTTTLNHASQSHFYVQIQGNTTIEVTGLRDGAPIVLHLAQDGTGSHTVAFGSVFDFGTVPPVVPTDANALMVVRGVVRGSTIYATVEYTSAPTQHKWDFILQHKESAGVNGQTPSAGARLTRTLNHVDTDHLKGVSLVSNVFTLSASVFRRVYIEWTPVVVASGNNRSYLVDTSGPTDVALSLPDNPDASTANTWGFGQTEQEILANRSFRIEHYAANAGSNGFGTAINVGGEDEVYLEVRGKRLA